MEDFYKFSINRFDNNGNIIGTINAVYPKNEYSYCSAYAACEQLAIKNYGKQIIDASYYRNVKFNWKIEIYK